VHGRGVRTAPHRTEVAASGAVLTDVAARCPICATYSCAGHRPRADCRHWAQVTERHELDDHRFCSELDACDWVETMRDAVLAAGLPYATEARPMVLVVVDRAGWPVYGRRTFSDHRSAKPARARAGGEGFGGQSRAWLVCGRCEGLH
jgi:hypothetical protein